MLKLCCVMIVGDWFRGSWSFPLWAFAEMLTPPSSFSFQVRLVLVDFCKKRPGILKSHSFSLVAGDKCHDIADHFSYSGSGCHNFLTVTPRFSDAIINTINNSNLQTWKVFYGHWKRCMIWFYVMWHSQKRRDEINLSLEKNKKFVKRDGVDEMIFRDYGSCLL